MEAIEDFARENADAVEVRPATGDRWQRRIDLAIVVVLAVASLLAAWSGHQTSLWSGEQSAFITEAERNQAESTRASIVGNQMMQIDIALFLDWLLAYQSGNAALADFYEERFPAHLRTAFDAWVASDPLGNPDAPSDPFRMAEYVVPQLRDAARFDEAAGAAFVAAEHADAMSQQYVLATILVALVLFFGGISTKAPRRSVQIALLGIAIALLLFTLQNLAVLPDASDWQLTPLWG